MERDKLFDLEYQVKHRLLEYLKAAQLHLDESFPEEMKTTCPLCGQVADIRIIPFAVPQSSWECSFCGSRGNAVDYAKGYYHLSRTQAVYEVCRKLGVPITHLDTVTASELLDTAYQPLEELIEGMLSPGVYILAGASKIGKSWLVLQIAHHISTGTPLWGRKTIKSGVLYLALEDTPRRIQRRLLQISDGETGEISFATEAEILGNGFEQQVSNFLQDHTDVKLVIVDTLVKVRQANASVNAYADDYATMTSFKRLADRYGVAMLIVHHTRKKEAKDIMDMISGTTGLMGCADGAMVLERPARRLPDAAISMTGRDHQDARIQLRQNAQTMCWEYVGYEDELPQQSQDPVLQAISTFLEDQGTWKGTAEMLLQQICAINPELKLKANTLARKLNAQIKELQNTYGIRYQWHRNTGGKWISLEFMSDMSDNVDKTPVGELSDIIDISTCGNI